MHNISNLGLDGLTEQQKIAIKKLAENQRGRFFVGIDIQTCINDLRKINHSSRDTKSEETEKAIFALCGFTP